MTKTVKRIDNFQMIGERFIVFFTKGLEHICEKEIRNNFPSVSIQYSSDKYIIFTVQSISLSKLVKLKTVDDVHFLLEYFKDIEDLNENFILENIPFITFNYTINFLQNLRRLDNTFSVTLSKYKNNNINRESLKNKIVKQIINLTKRTYTEFDHSNFDLRIHIESSNVIYSCRIPKKSLHTRSYRKCEMKGALKPPIAASSSMLINPIKGKKLVDNFCGTIL